MQTDTMTGVMRTLRDWRLDDQVQVESAPAPGSTRKCSRQVSDLVFSCLDGMRYRVAADVFSVWFHGKKRFRVRMAGVATPMGKRHHSQKRPSVATRDMEVELCKTTYYIRALDKQRWVSVSRLNWLKYLNDLA